MTIGKNRRTRTMLLAACAALAIAPATAYAQQGQQRVSYSIPAQDLGTALTELARQSNREIVFSADLTRGKRAPRLSGRMSFEEALGKLLVGSGLRYRANSGGSIVIETNGQRGNAPGTDEPVAEEDRGKAEILVVGSRSQNADIRRTEDDPQPYVVLSNKDIERSGATSVEDFLRTRLPMDTQATTPAQTPNTSTPRGGNLALRGLSPAQTLVLIDGRRVPGVGIAGASGFGTPNINAIPPLAIERIEVLPATAGGIYGGSATGGVINIILKRDYTGVDAEVTYGNSTRGDSQSVNLSVTGGLSANSGDTSLIVSANKYYGDALSGRDRDFAERALRLDWANRPADFTRPPIAYTPNICSTATASSTTCSSAILTLKPAFGGTSLGSNITHVPVGFSGVSTSGVSGLVANAGTYNFGSAAFRNNLLPEVRSESYSISGRHQFAPNLDIFADGGYDRLVYTDKSGNSTTLNIPATDTNNPFQQNIAVSYLDPASIVTTTSKLENEHLRLGLNWRPSKHWTVGVEHSWARSVSEAGATGFQSLPGSATYLRTVALRDSNLSPADPLMLGAAGFSNTGPFVVALNDSFVRVSGTPFSLPGGPLNISGYLERREESAGDGIFESAPVPPRSFIWFPAKSQEIRSVYLEARVPVFGANGSFPFRRMEVVLGVRHDEYELTAAQGPTSGGFSVPSRDGPFPAVSTTSSHVKSTDYTIAASYQPIEDLIFRASYGTGFLPPNLGQVITSVSTQDLSFVGDPKRGNTSLGTTITELDGGRPDLDPERSTSFSVGLVFTPRFLHGFRFSADYTKIKKSNEIGTLVIDTLLAREGDFPGRVVRGPNQPGDLPGWLGPITQIDLTSVNVTTTRVEAFDFQIDYELATRNLGTWRAYAIGTKQTTLARRTLPGDPVVNSVGFGDGPLQWRGNFGIDWSEGGWSAGWNAQYYDSYGNCLSTVPVTCPILIQQQGSDRIPSRLYHDFYFQYDFGKGRSRSLLAGSQIRLGVQNLFDTSPPIIASALGTRGYSTYGDPRLRRFTVTLRKHF